MKKRIVMLTVLFVVFGILATSSYAVPPLCPWCGDYHYTTTSSTVVDTYRVQCTHCDEGYDSIARTSYVYYERCDNCGNLRHEHWNYAGSSTTCHGWNRPTVPPID